MRGGGRIRALSGIARPPRAVHYLPLLAEGVLPFLSLLLLVFQPNMPGKALITAANTTVNGHHQRFYFTSRRIK